jgi:translocation protein SEC63
MGIFPNESNVWWFDHVDSLCFFYQLILLAYAGRIGRLPSLDSIEHAMKLSPMVVQALWDKQSPLLQLPHIEEDMLKHFHSRRRNIKSLQQLAQMKVIKAKDVGLRLLHVYCLPLRQDEDRRSLLRSLSEDQYKDLIRVLAMMPLLNIEITTEVVDDEDQHVVTAGSIITVTVVLTRK